MRIKADVSCVVWDSKEDVDHLLSGCTFSIEVWMRFLGLMGSWRVFNGSMLNMMEEWSFNPFKEKERKARNF